MVSEKINNLVHVRTMDFLVDKVNVVNLIS